MRGADRCSRRDQRSLSRGIGSEHFRYGCNERATCGFIFVSTSSGVADQLPEVAAVGGRMLRAQSVERNVALSTQSLHPLFDAIGIFGTRAHSWLCETLLDRQKFDRSELSTHDA